MQKYAKIEPETTSTSLRLPADLERTITAICLIDRVSRIWQKQIERRIEVVPNERKLEKKDLLSLEFDFDEHFEFGFE